MDPLAPPLPPLFPTLSPRMKITEGKRRTKGSSPEKYGFGTGENNSNPNFLASARGIDVDSPSRSTWTGG
jgi:hypothetical protein